MKQLQRWRGEDKLNCSILCRQKNKLGCKTSTLSLWNYGSCLLLFWFANQQELLKLDEKDIFGELNMAHFFFFEKYILFQGNFSHLKHCFL